MSQQTDKIKNDLLKSIGAFDEDKWREDLEDRVDKYGVKYTEFKGQAVNDRQNFGTFSAKPPVNKKRKLFIIFGITTVVLAGTSFFLYKKGYFHKWFKK